MSEFAGSRLTGRDQLLKLLSFLGDSEVSVTLYLIMAELLFLKGIDPIPHQENEVRNYPSIEIWWSTRRSPSPGTRPMYTRKYSTTTKPM